MSLLLVVVCVREEWWIDVGAVADDVFAQGEV